MNGVDYSFLAMSVAGASLTAALFLKFAHAFGFVAHPNDRSSHGAPTVTAMGVLIPISVIIYNFWRPGDISSGFFYGFLLVSLISFIDDIYFLKHSLRLICQIVGLGLMIYELPFQSDGVEMISIGLAGMLLGIGVINAYNFMDGVNGMLTLHCIAVLLSLLYLNETYSSVEGLAKPFASSAYIINVIVPLVIFSFFNVRAHAKAFIGDVGAISIAFIILQLMFLLLLNSGNYTYLLLFSVFGADAGLTVCYKLILGENIFVPHRDFVFKKLVHIKGLSHLKVSLYYLLFQVLINAAIIFLVPAHPKLSSQLAILFIGTLFLISLYIYLQHKLNRLESISKEQA